MTMADNYLSNFPLLQKADGTVHLNTYYTPGTSTYFDILGLNPEVSYQLGLQIKTHGGTAQDTGLSLAVTTREFKGYYPYLFH